MRPDFNGTRHKETVFSLVQTLEKVSVMTYKVTILSLNRSENKKRETCIFYNDAVL